MARFIISEDEKLVAFSQLFILKDYTVSLPKVDEEPTIDRKDGKIGIYTVLFE